MARSVTSALQAELTKVVTRIGYLVSFSTSPVMRWCNVGLVNWSGMVFVEYDFEVRGLGGSVDRPPDATLTAQNLDGAVSAIFQTADMSSVTCDIWQVAPAAVAADDVVRLGRFMLGDCEIGLDKITVRLVPESSLYAFSPKRRIDPLNGFSYALPEGSQIAWESEIYIVEMSRG